MNNPKVVAVLGPTATGKSDLGVALAHKFDGEVISADSRQIYHGLDIGTGKITASEMQNIPHHLLDIRDPAEHYSAAEFKKDAYGVIRDIHARNKLPLLVGGTGFFISAVIDNISFPEVHPDHQLRRKLSEKTTDRLFELLRERDPRRARTVDPHNRHRLIRAIEITETQDRVPLVEKQPTPFEALQIGLWLEKEALRERIHTRLEKRIESGMIEEVVQLHKNGLSYERMDSLGLEYRFLSRYLKGELSFEDMKSKLETEIWRYAKRQLTWFRRDKRTKWFKPDQYEEIFKYTHDFLQS